ncbi:MAG TPA: hypothetical protein VE944_10425 [Nostoc sp.]|uniref:hypothetical protein n=1 Tax=Nostoc sp. TaxID=1180 RepID=UPI002D598C8C|nr:hypothetical protein [Nostoc sp.]HYX14764.1 hypothetical protein [Nostoc sp.]
MLDPVTLYKDGKARSIPAIDAPGWMANGWAKQPTAPEVIPLSVETSSKRKKLVAADNDGDSLPES